MRLRPRRPARRLGEDWVQPRRSGRWTTLGNLDSSARASVDPAGLVSLAGAAWSLDWWVGAEDRWHLPAAEVAVRQVLVGNSPVVETRLRVPSGDAVHRAYAARDASGAEALVVEVENASKVPFALALALRPHGQDAIGRIDEVGLAGRTATVDGRVAVQLSRSPGRMALSDGRVDPATVVLAGGAEPVATASARSQAGLASMAVLFPLAHTATVRVVLPLTDTLVDLDALPDAAQVAAGWQAQTARATRIEVPDRRLRDAVLACSRHLLLSQGSAQVAAALDLLALPDEAARVLTAPDLARRERPGAALHAVARHWELTHDDAFAEDVVGLVATLVPALARAAVDDRSRGRRALPATAALLAAAGEDRAAADVLKLMQGLPPPVDDDPAAELAALLDSAAGTWTWAGAGVGHDPVANGALVALVRALLLRDTSAGLVLVPTAVPDAWLGQGWELHDAPTAAGRLSYAVRWHGERPALLWHLDAHPGMDRVPITAPGLDPTWSTTEARGEALLAPVAQPDRPARRGLSMPVTIETMPPRHR